MNKKERKKEAIEEIWTYFSITLLLCYLIFVINNQLLCYLGVLRVFILILVCYLNVVKFLKINILPCYLRVVKYCVNHLNIFLHSPDIIFFIFFINLVHSSTSALATAGKRDSWWKQTYHITTNMESTHKIDQLLYALVCLFLKSSLVFEDLFWYLEWYKNDCSSISMLLGLTQLRTDHWIST